MVNIINTKKNGFTIVELLIVIVVIGILAAITIVAYNGIQNRARDAVLLGDISSIKSTIVLYRADKGVLPICEAGNGQSCPLSSLDISLVPAYASSVPDGGDSYPYMYVATPQNGGQWSIRAYKASLGVYCKAGENMIATWWSNAPEC